MIEAIIGVLTIVSLISGFIILIYKKVTKSSESFKVDDKQLSIVGKYLDNFKSSLVDEEKIKKTVGKYYVTHKEWIGVTNSINGLASAIKNQVDSINSLGKSVMNLHNRLTTVESLQEEMVVVEDKLGVLLKDIDDELKKIPTDNCILVDDAYTIDGLMELKKDVEFIKMKLAERNN